MIRYNGIDDIQYMGIHIIPDAWLKFHFSLQQKNEYKVVVVLFMRKKRHFTTVYTS